MKFFKMRFFLTSQLRAKQAAVLILRFAKKGLRDMMTKRIQGC